MPSQAKVGSGGHEVTMTDYTKYLVAALERGDAEKQLIAAKIQDLGNDQRELGDLRTELQNRSSEVFKCQQEISELRMVVQEERERIARLSNENAVLQAQTEDDRVKISNLIRMRKTDFEQNSDLGSMPIRVSVMKGAANNNSRHQQNASMSLRSVVSDFTPPSRVHVDVRKTLDSDLQAPPSSGLVAALSKEVETLKQLLNEQRRSYENERSARVQEERAYNGQQEEMLQRYARTIDHLQQAHNEATKDLVSYRHTQQIEERKLRGELEILKAKVGDLERALTHEKERKTNDMTRALQTAHSRTDDVVKKIRKQAESQKLSMCGELSDVTEKLEIAEKDCSVLRRQIVSLKKSSKREIDRKNAEMEGLQTEVNLMKQHLRAVEKKVFFAHARNPHEMVNATELTL